MTQVQCPHCEAVLNVKKESAEEVAAMFSARESVNCVHCHAFIRGDRFLLSSIED
jgi:nitrate/TMAO reductase-like tetraheme cytochrome c subunit